MADFNPYKIFFNGEAEEDIMDFMQGEHQFEEYCDKIAYLKGRADEVPIVLEHSVRLGMFDVHRAPLIKRITTTITDLKLKLLRKLINEYQGEIKALHEEYIEIIRRTSIVPENTAELMKLISFLCDLEDFILTEMEDRLRDCMKYILFLTDYLPLSDREIMNNCTTISE